MTHTITIPSSLRISMLAPFGIRPKGTLSARMLPLAQALCRRGHEVSIIAPPVQNPEDAGTWVDHGGVPVLHAPAARLPGGLGWSVSLLQLALAEQPHLLHLFKPKGYGGLAALLAARQRPDLPLVLDTDDWEGPGGWNDLLPYPAPARRLFAWQEQDLPRRAAAVTVSSRTLEQRVHGFGVPSERIFYLPSGATIPVLHAAPPRRLRLTSLTLLLYTRFWEFDVRDVVAALVAIRQRRPEAQLLVVGKGERREEEHLLDLAARAGLAAAIDYRGWVEPAAIPALMAQADVALAPLNDTPINRARGMAKLLELLGAGLPVVAGRVGQAAEYIEHGVSGWLVTPGDSGALAQGALHLLGSAELRGRISQGARNAARSFAWDELALIAEDAYRYALGNRSMS